MCAIHEREPEKHADVQGVFLSGSYKRRTAITPFNDVDMFMEVGEGWLRCSHQEAVAHATRILQSTDLASSIRRQDRSVGVKLKHIGQLVNIDVVPAVAQAGGYMIPDSTSGHWIFTNPEAALVAVETANKRCEKSLNSLIKLAKYWNTVNAQQDGTKPLKSFHLEVMCYTLPWPQPDFRAAFANLLQHLSQQLQQRTPTPGVLGAYVDAYMQDDRPRKERALRLLQIAAVTAREAVGAEAHRLWRGLLPEY